MIKSFLLTVACFALQATTLFSQQEVPHIHFLADPEAAERNHSVDITHMKVEVSFEPQLGKVNGKVTHQFTTLQNKIDTLFFNAPGIEILTATLDNENLAFYSNNEGVVVKFSKSLNWDEKHNIVFIYTAKPKRGIYFIGWNQAENTGTPDINYIRKQIWTQGQGIDNRHWIPMYDDMGDKFITETHTTMANPYKVLSNGKKVSVKDNGNGTSTWHYAMEKPHAGYLLMLAIGNYEVKETTTKRGTPVQFWYYPEFKERVYYTSLHTEKMIEHLEDETGIPYAWGSYSQVMVQNFLYGAMENTSATIFGDFFTTDARGFKDRNYMGVNHHELTHQWFGDLITARGGSDVWLQESFATFYPKLFFKELEGDDAYQWAVRGEHNSALEQSKKDNYPVRHTKGGTTRLYPKGSAVLSMLRHQLGDENFKRFIQHYLTVHGFKNVEAWDFQKAVKDKLGMNYDWFFDQWIHRGGEPHFNVSYNANKKNLTFVIEQTHATDGHVTYFKTPVDIAIYFKNGQVKRETIWVADLATQNIVIPINTEEIIDFVLFDEKSNVMKKMVFEKYNDELFAQAAKAKYMIDRYDAILAMSKIPLKDKQAFLQARFAAEKHHAIRAEIAKQLANQKTLTKWYVNIVKDSKADVKNAFIKADTTIKDHENIFAMLLKDSAYSVVENALTKLMTSKEVSDKNKLGYLKTVATVSGQNNNVRVKYLEYQITLNAANKTRELFETDLINLISANYEFRTRVAAGAALNRLNICNQTVVNHLIDAVLTYNSRLAVPCAGYLKEMSKKPENLELIKKSIDALNDDQKVIIKQYGLML
ncbi:MAG: M1 family metallopeptidase [Bacteroidota bacterium]|nr:M1 family metallopeptidase [Bacteroidota bacterium]